MVYWAVALPFACIRASNSRSTNNFRLSLRKRPANSCCLSHFENVPSGENMCKLSIALILVGIFLTKTSEAVWKRYKETSADKDKKTAIKPTFNDRGYKRQWYLVREDGPTLNVLPIWEEGITGKDVVVAVVDDGLNIYHSEIKENYQPRYSYDFVDDDLYPNVFSGNGHGTNCAGVIAATANNGICGVGIAYNAKLAGIRLITSKIAPEDITAKALQYHSNYVDIYSNSWGPMDNGMEILKLGDLAKEALLKGTTTGRKKKGSIYIFSSGNGGTLGDSCAFDGYVNSIHTIAIGAVTKQGYVAPYSEACSAILASTFGSDDVITCSGNHDNKSCTENFGKTSASAAMASGIVALLLEARPTLTWRDVQHLIVRSSVPQNIQRNDKGWIVNKAGLPVHNKLGFGLMDAEKLVGYGRKWSNVPKKSTCTIITKPVTRKIQKTGLRDVFMPVVTSKSCNIRYLEHVEVKFSLNYTRRGLLRMDLYSPQQTRSRILYARLMDTLTRKKSYTDLSIKSVHYWGEDPRGNWYFKLNNALPYLGKSGTLFYFILTLHGTETNPLAKNARLFPKSAGKGSCHGSQSKTNVCCQNNVLWSGKGVSCCGRQNYDSTTHACCNKNNIVWKGPGCGGKDYDPCFQMCCAGKIHYKISGFKCCGNKSYYEKLYGCCDGKLTKKYWKCCANREYNPRYYECCDNKSLARKRWCYSSKRRAYYRCVQCP